VYVGEESNKEVGDGASARIFFLSGEEDAGDEGLYSKQLASNSKRDKGRRDLQPKVFDRLAGGAIVMGAAFSSLGCSVVSLMKVSPELVSSSHEVESS
jgi:hypothetical protein